MDFLVFIQMAGVNPQTVQCVSQGCTKLVLTHNTQKRRLFPKVVQHGQHITRGAARICLKDRVSLSAHSVLCKIDQKLAQGDNIKILVHLYSPCPFYSTVNYIRFACFTQVPRHNYS